MPNIFPNLSLFYQNVRGLNTKINQARTFVNSNCYDIIGITETWLSDGVLSSEIFNNDYHVFRHDRVTHAGGALLAIKTSLNCVRLSELESDCVEDVWVKIRLDYSWLYLCCVYLPPHDTHSTPLIRNFLKSLYDIMTCMEDGARVLIMGDFNMRYLKWSTNDHGVFQPDGHIGHSLHEELVDLMTCFDLTNHSSILNHQARQLDLILSNTSADTVEVKHSDVRMCSVDAYHPPLEIKCRLNVSENLANIDYPKYDFRRCNYSDLNEAILSFDWTPLQDSDPNTAAEYFYNSIYHLIQRFVPLKPLKNTYPIFYSSRLICIIELKVKYHKLWKKNGREEDYLTFKKFRAQQNVLEPKCFAKFVRHVESRVHVCMKEFWQFTKSLRKTNTYPSTLRNGSHTESETQKICDMFATFFSSIYDRPVPPSIVPSHNPVSAARSLNRISIDQSKVMRLLGQCDANKGPGSDGISGIFLKGTAEYICKPLTLLFQNSIDNGVFPDTFKITKIHPIFKNGDPSLVSNYRPIAILNTIEKIFERVVHDQVYDFIKPSISRSQHAFQKQRSTISNLLEQTYFLVNAFEGREQVDVIYADMSKAFDLVCHDILITKLCLVGLNGSLLDWFRSYLSARPNHVTFNGTKSDEFFPSSGVPQGSILGPLLFLIYMNDAPTVVNNSFCSAFADDFKFSRIIRSMSDAQLLQSDFDSFSSWCSLNGLQINSSKCARMTYSNKFSNIYHDYQSDSTSLNQVSSFKDLGVTFDSHLSFDVHIDALAKKAFKTLGFVIRTSRSFRSIDAIKCLYFSLVRSQLEYGCPIWFPYYKTHIDRLERIQRRFTRFIFRKFHIPYINYDARLKILNMKSLFQRRTEADGLVLYKLVNNLLDCDVRRDISMRSNNHNIRNMALFGIRTYTINCAYYSFLPRTMRLYNSIFGQRNTFSLTPQQFKIAWNSGLAEMGFDSYDFVINLVF